jgi:hypothetical protein
VIPTAFWNGSKEGCRRPKLLIARGENAEEEKRCSDIGENSIGPWQQYYYF